MNAETERQMAVGGSANIKPIGIRELRRIAVGGPDTEMNVAAGRDRNAAQCGVPGGATVSQLVGAFHAQKLLDRRVDQLGMLRKVMPGLGMPQQKINAVANEVGRGLVAGIEQKDAIVNELEFRQPVGARHSRRRARWPR